MRLAILLVLLFIFGVAHAQEEVTIWSDGQPLILPAQNPAIIQQQVGAFLHGTIHGATTVNCSLQNCMTQQDYQGIEFSGQMPAYRAEIQTGQSTIVFEPQQDSGLPFGLNITDLALIGVAVVAIVITALVVRSRVNH